MTKTGNMDFGSDAAAKHRKVTTHDGLLLIRRHIAIEGVFVFKRNYDCPQDMYIVADSASLLPLP